MPILDMAFQNIMHIKEIRYHRVKNLGNYESARCEMVAELNEDDDVEDAFAQLQYQVEKALGNEESSEKEVAF